MITVSDRGVDIEGTFLRVARLHGDKYCFLDDPASFIEELRTCGHRIDLFTFLQRVAEPSPKYPYPMEWDNFAALPVSTYEHWLSKQIRFAPRGRLRQAEKKGVSVREIPLDDVLIRGIWEIYNESPVRQGKRFPHYGMKLERVRGYAGTFLDRSIFVGAFLAGRLIGFAKLTMDETATQAGLMHILSMAAHRDKCPTNALLAQAVRSCAERHVKYLVYANFAYGNKQRDSLSDFKERNGFQRIDVPRYYIPLTTTGRIAFRLGLHHKLIERLPESIITKLRDYRAGWYSRKLQSSAGAS